MKASILTLLMMVHIDILVPSTSGADDAAKRYYEMNLLLSAEYNYPVMVSVVLKLFW